MNGVLGIAMAVILSFSQMTYIGDMTISAYSIDEGNGENKTTASGNEPKAYKTIATSNEFPFGTHLYIEGIGECVVEDRGGELIQSGERIDLFIGEDNPEDFGLKERKVYRYGR